MNKLVWRLLRQHISVGQLAGFFLANLFGMTIVLLSIQFYRDVLPLFTQGDSFMKKEYIIATKKSVPSAALPGAVIPLPKKKSRNCNSSRSPATSGLLPLRSLKYQPGWVCRKQAFTCLPKCSSSRYPTNM